MVGNMHIYLAWYIIVSNFYLLISRNILIQCPFSDIQFQTLSKYYLQEAEWFHQGYTPSFEEHVNVSVITAGGQVLSIGLLVGMGDDVATKELRHSSGSLVTLIPFGLVDRYHVSWMTCQHSRYLYSYILLIVASF
jgi:hypothetical protein